MSTTKFVISIILATVIVIGGSVWIASKNSTDSTFTVSAQTNAVVNQYQHDWGTIPLQGGNVTQSFTIQNAGTQALQIRNISTSCTCTKARILVDESVSPLFGMHQKSNWVGEVQPGKQAQLEVIYDPAFHGPSGIGQITRQIVVETNDPKNPRLSFSVSANVVN